MRQNNYTLILIFASPNINIINTRKMMSPPNEVKIEQESPQRYPQAGRIEESHRRRHGNSRIFAKSGHWSGEEKLRYVLFLDHHAGKLASKEKRRLWHIFRAMSAFVGTRKPNQCRSHHQKMEAYFQSLPAIIAYFKARLPAYAHHYQHALPALRAVDQGLRPLLRHDQFLEESIPNNESLPLLPQLKKQGRRRSSNTSIRLEDDALRNEVTDKELPKTDHSLNNFPQPQNGQQVTGRERPRLDFGHIDGGDFAYPQSVYPFYMPTFPFFSMEGHYSTGPQNKTAENFFEYYQRRCSSEEEASGWMECERLYRAWRDTVQSLIHSNL